MTATIHTVETGPTPLAWSLDHDALRDIAPVLVSIAPFAMLVGVTMSELSIGGGLGVTASGLIFAGSAQMGALTLLGSGAGVLAVLATVAAINARLMMYAAALEPRFRNQPAWFRWFGPHLLVDQTYVLASSRPELAEPRRFRRYWLTMGTALAAVWLGTISAGLALGPILPADSPLGFAPTAVIIGLLVPKLTDRRAIRAAVVAALVAGIGSGLPNGLGLLAGAVCGVAATMSGDRSSS